MTAAGMGPTNRLAFPAKLRWHWRNNPNLELRLAWITIIVFYNIFGIVFFVMTRTQPPPRASWALPRILQWFGDHHWGLLSGFGIIFVVGAFATASTALIVYSMRRMSVSPAFSWSYLIIYSLAAVPGMLLTCIALVVGAMRPDRSPELIGLLYDLGFLAFSGTMGIFLVGSLIWAVAILLDENGILPKWFGYFNICNALTEVVVATCLFYRDGPFAWNGVISFYINFAVFAVYTGVFITLLGRLSERENMDDPAVIGIRQPL